MNESTNDGTFPTASLVAIREVSGGGFVWHPRTLSVYSDGTLHLSRRGREETRNASPAQIRLLQDALSRPEWRELESSYGHSRVNAKEISVIGGGKRITITIPPDVEVETPPILSKVLEHLDRLWPGADLQPPP